MGTGIGLILEGFPVRFLYRQQGGYAVSGAVPYT